jgi:hypothetical protein
VRENTGDMGYNLQLDLNAMDKAATLFGILREAIPESEDINQEMPERWQEIGVRRLKMERARKLYK